MKTYFRDPALGQKPEDALIDAISIIGFLGDALNEETLGALGSRVERRADGLQLILTMTGNALDEALGDFMDLRKTSEGARTEDPRFDQVRELISRKPGAMAATIAFLSSYTEPGTPFEDAPEDAPVLDLTEDADTDDASAADRRRA